MRVKFSKLVITVTVLTLVLASSFVGGKTTRAASNSNSIKSIEQDDQNTPAFYKDSNDEEVAPFTISEDGSVHWLSKSEYQEAKNGENLDSLGTPNDDNNSIIGKFRPLESPFQGSFYKQTSASNYTGDPITVANGLRGPGTISYSKIWETTIDVTFGVELSSAEKSAVKSGASITLQKLTSTACEYSFHVPSGYIGWVAFVPYKHKSIGTVTTYYTGKTVTKHVTARAARKSGSHAYGYYELIKQKK